MQQYQRQGRMPHPHLARKNHDHHEDGLGGRRCLLDRIIASGASNGTPDDVARAVVWIASSDAGSSSGLICMWMAGSAPREHR
jgi:hypothetical protein